MWNWRGAVRKTCLALLVWTAAVLPGVCAAEADAPDTLVLRGYWFYDGFLADDPGVKEMYAITGQPVTVYAYADMEAPVTGELPAGTKVRIRELAFVAHPGNHLLTTTAPVRTTDGSRELAPGTVLGGISYVGDAAAVYTAGQVVAVYLPDLRPPHEWAQSLSRDLGQWLRVETGDGLSGWCRYAAETGAGTRDRWRTQPHAAGGSANFNRIVFSDSMPEFKPMTIFFASAPQ